MVPFNLSATLNIFRAVKNPALCYPHLIVNTFNDLPVPLGKGLGGGEKGVDIRAVILDKDNCFAAAHALEVFPEYNSKFKQFQEAYPGDKLLIVSNSAGTLDDTGNKNAATLEKNTGAKVLQHSTKKPGCYNEIFEFLLRSPDAGVTSPDQVAVVGDRLFTDILMANMMGSWGVWVRNGVVSPERTFFGKIERGLVVMLEKRGWRPPTPSSGLFGDLLR